MSIVYYIMTDSVDELAQITEQLDHEITHEVDDDELAQINEQLDYEITHKVDDDDMEEALEGVTPADTPSMFYGDYIEPVAPSQAFEGKYMVMSYVFPDTRAYMAYIRFTLIDFLSKLFATEIKAYGALHDDVELLEPYSRLFEAKTSLAIIKQYGHHIKLNGESILQAFYSAYPGYEEIMGNPERQANNLVEHLIRPYEIFDTEEDASNYINTNYNTDYPYKLFITKLGNWTPIYGDHMNTQALKPYDETQDEVIDILRNHRVKINKEEAEFRSRIARSKRNHENINRRVKTTASKSMRKKMRDSVVNNFISGVIEELSKFDKPLRRKIRKKLLRITPTMITDVLEARNAEGSELQAR